MYLHIGKAKRHHFKPILPRIECNNTNHRKQ